MREGRRKLLYIFTDDLNRALKVLNALLVSHYLVETKPQGELVENVHLYAPRNDFGEEWFETCGSKKCMKIPFTTTSPYTIKVTYSDSSVRHPTAAVDEMLKTAKELLNESNNRVELVVIVLFYENQNLHCNFLSRLNKKYGNDEVIRKRVDLKVMSLREHSNCHQKFPYIEKSIKPLTAGIQSAIYEMTTYLPTDCSKSRIIKGAYGVVWNKLRIEACIPNDVCTLLSLVNHLVREASEVLEENIGNVDPLEKLLRTLPDRFRRGFDVSRCDYSVKYFSLTPCLRVRPCIKRRYKFILKIVKESKEASDQEKARIAMEMFTLTERKRPVLPQPEDVFRHIPPGTLCEALSRGLDCYIRVNSIKLPLDKPKAHLMACLESVEANGLLNALETLVGITHQCARRVLPIRINRIVAYPCNIDEGIKRARCNCAELHGSRLYVDLVIEIPSFEFGKLSYSNLIEELKGDIQSISESTDVVRIAISPVLGDLLGESVAAFKGRYRCVIGNKNRAHRLVALRHRLAFCDVRYCDLYRACEEKVACRLDNAEVEVEESLLNEVLEFLEREVPPKIKELVTNGPIWLTAWFKLIESFEKVFDKMMDREVLIKLSEGETGRSLRLREIVDAHVRSWGLGSGLEHLDEDIKRRYLSWWLAKIFDYQRSSRNVEEVMETAIKDILFLIDAFK